MFRLIGRHFKEAFQGIFRHFANALSAAMCVTFTLVLVALLTIIIGNVSQMTRALEEDIQIFVRINNEVEESQIEAKRQQILLIDGVKDVEYSDKNSELDRFIASYGKDGEIFEIYRDDIPLSRAFLVGIKSGYSLDEMSKQISKIDGLKDIEFGGTTTQEFISLLTNVRNGGYVVVLALTLIAIFLISNTIKVTIYNRNKEISIMRQVGASNSYIRQPFVIEGVFIGLMGAILPVALTIYGYKYLYEATEGQIVTGMLKLQPVNPFAYEVAGFLLMVAMIVGLIGSFISVNRYLRWRR